jgi:hypothetical protein
MPAGLPPGMPGMGLEIDGAIQQAPQPARQFMHSPAYSNAEGIADFPAGFSSL